VGESVIRCHADQLVDRPSETDQTTKPTTVETCSQTEYGNTEVEDLMEDMDIAGPAREEVPPTLIHIEPRELTPVTVPVQTERRYPARVRRPPERLSL